MESMFQKAAQENPQTNAQSETPTTPTPASGSMESMFAQAAQQGEAAPTTPGVPAFRSAEYQKDNGDGTFMGGVRAAGHNIESLYDRVEHMFTQPATVRTLGEQTDSGQRSYEGGNKILAPEQAMTPSERRAHPMATAIAESAGEMTSAGNVAILAGTAGFGQLATTAKILPRLLSAGFSVMAMKSAYDRYPAIKEAWKNGDVSEVERLMTHAVLDLGMAAMAGQHAAVGEAPLKPGERAPETQYEKVQGEENAADARAVGGPPPTQPANVNPYAPAAVEPRGTKRTILRPTTKEVAGVQVPITATQQEGGSLPAKVAEKFASPGAASEFQRTQTAPAATQAMVSTLGQTAEDKINAHQALVNGEAAPEQIAGTRTPSQHDTIDKIAQATKATSEQTYQHADDISQRELQEWEAARDKAIETHKAGIDQHNSVVDQYNSALSEGEEPMERVEFNPDEVRGIPEKPKTYNELRSEQQQALANGSSQDAAVREKAHQTEIPKAEKNLDKWFQDHSDEISPAEYNSAKKLRAEAEIYQSMANGLRAAMNKGSITANTMRGLEATVDNKAIRRGQAPGQFKRLLGDEGYSNWKSVSQLFEPVKGGPNVGQYVLELAASHLIPFGVVGKLGTEAILNKVLFDSTFGGWFTQAADSVARTGTISQSLKDTLTGLWKNERGEAGAPGSVPLTEADEAKAQTPSMEEQFAKAAGPQHMMSMEPGPSGFPEAKVTANNPESEISTRAITSTNKGVKTLAANDTANATGWDAIETAEKQKPGFMRDLLDKVQSYKDNGLKLNAEQKADPRKGLKAVVDHWASNLEWLHDNMPAEHREIAKQWYDSAHKMATGIATKYGTEPRKVAAVIAALSPQNPWDMNVGQAERLVSMYQTSLDHPFTPEMDQAITDRKVKALKGKEPNIEFANQLESLRGKTWGELTVPGDKDATRYNQALWMRMLDEAHGNRQTPVYAPDGKIRSYQTFNWGLADPMAKSLDIMESDGSAQSIHEIIGDGHKIRNFYNNIISPDSELGHATIDTHHVNADMLKPMSSKNDVEVKDNFGGAPGHGATGQKGTYSLHHAALKQAADSRGILPREMQSITWEAIKTLMGDEKKTPELRKAVTAIWQKYQKGGLTLNEARENIVKAAGSFDKPAWAKERANNGQSNIGGNEAGGGTPDQSKLPPVGISGEPSSPAGAGRGSDVPGAVPTEGRAQTGSEGKAKAVNAAYDAILQAKGAGRAKAPVRPTETPEFKKWFGESKVVDEQGEPQVVYHGTTHDFDTFKPERGNDENAFGKGYYFTSDPTDASENYAGVGPDLKSRIENRAEEIMNESDKNYSTDKAAYEAATKQATKELAGGNPNVMPVHVKMENPVEISPHGGTQFTIDVDEDGNESGNGVELYNSIMRSAAGYEDRHGNTVDGQKLWNEISELGPEFSAHDLYQRVSAVLSEQDIFSPGDFLKDVFKDMGYDGIKQDAYNAFSKYGDTHKGRGGMDNMAPDTTHYIAFEPTQVKSAIGNRGTFDPKDPNIMHQTVTQGTGEHQITADINPADQPPRVAKWKGQPAPTLSRRPNGRVDYTNLEALADHYNANDTPENRLNSAAHEIAHTFVQHHLGVPTHDIAIGLGNRAVRAGKPIAPGLGKSSMTTISGGFLSPGKGWTNQLRDAKMEAVNGNPEPLKNFLKDYTTQLMAGRAMEELLGNKPSDVDEHTKADHQMAKQILKSSGVGSHIHDALLRDATERAKGILKENFDTVKHITAQSVHHHGQDFINGETFHKYRQGGVYEKKK